MCISFTRVVITTEINKRLQTYISMLHSFYMCYTYILMSIITNMKHFIIGIVTAHIIK